MSKINTNTASNTQYQATLGKFKNLRYMCQSVNIPSVTLPGLEVYPKKADLLLPGDRLLYTPMSFDFLIDEDFGNYNELYNWMIDLTNNQQAHLEDFTEVIIVLYNKDKAVKTVTFKNAWCTGLSDIQLTVVEEDSKILCTATFEYSNFEIENI